MAREFDLFGEPIPENKGKPGANGHVATSENVNKVRMLVLSRWTSAQIAEELGITVPTLNKHYFKNSSIKRARKTVLSEVKGRVLLQLDKEASAGNVSALKELFKILEREQLADLSADMTSPAKGKAPKPKLGKKQQRMIDAAEPDDQWGFLPSAADQQERPN
jgi:hypothetical protein